MKTNKIAIWHSVLALSALMAVPLAATAGPTSSKPVKAYIYSSIYDEHDTNAYFHNPQICPFLPLIDDANVLPDSTVGGLTTAWDQFLSPWASVSLAAGLYDDHTNCSTASSCLRAEISTNDKVFSLDTRATLPARKLTFEFTDPWNNTTNLPGNQQPPFGITISTVGLFQVSGLDPLTSMGICSSRACPEAKQIATKFWFNDPSSADVMWRVDWRGIRVLRMSQKQWYFIADACGGSQLAGLSKLEGNRTRPRETLNGYYLIPLFFAAELK